MAKENYQRQLVNPLWQKKRLEILQRDDFKCVKCGNGNLELHIHHKSYEKGKAAWEYPNENFDTLCFRCHEIVENYKKNRSDFNYKSLTAALMLGKDDEGDLICYSSNIGLGLSRFDAKNKREILNYEHFGNKNSLEFLRKTIIRTLKFI